MELDLASHAQNKLLDLYCEVKRVSSDVLLAVRLEMHGTNENLLSFEASAPFFQPNLVLQYFAVSFPHTFAGQVLPDIPYPYPLSTNRFHLGFEASELYFVGDSISWDFADLENDLIMTEGVPMNVIKSVARYRARKSTRETIAGTVVGIGGLTYVATTVAILILGEGLAGGGDSLRLNSPEQVPTGLWIANIAGLVTMLFGPIGFSIPPPKDLITTLNGWCCTSERD
jgi:hypothetical protein